MSLKENIQKGRKGEDIAQKYLLASGWKIIDLNWRYSKNAEIDIIAEDKGTLVFVEVKTRSSLNFGHPFEAINNTKIQKIHSAILAYINQSEKNYKTFRFDGIAIVGLKNPKIEHIKNIGQF
ncbi:MAG: YraN family protein [Candidatus Gastranaerophilales bacterium]|nr:YraN family protein [Candidatus Gastranaerophilales bacterium]